MQLYIRNLTSQLPHAIKELKGFNRINLKSSESKIDSIIIPVKEIFYYDSVSQEYMVEPGKYEIQIGASSADIRLRDTIELVSDQLSLQDSIIDTLLIIYLNPATDNISISNYQGIVTINDMLLR